MDPAGTAARLIAEIWWVMLAGATVIFVGVMAAALYALKPKRRGYRLSEKGMLIGGGLIFPIVTLGALSVYALIRGEQIAPRTELEAYQVEAVARQWRWTFTHPDGVVSEDVMRIPVGEPVEVLITSEDVIHSFWVPRLAGKVDAVPGITNRLRLVAEEPGVFRGQCAEFCGLGHARMGLTVIAGEGDGA